MSEQAPQDYFRNTGQSRLAFNAVDLKFFLKMRSFIEIAMPPMFAHLEREVGMFSLRQKGIAPIMFFLDFHALPLRLSFGRPVETESRISVHRHVSEGKDGTPGRSRLLLDMRADLKAYEGKPTKGGLGYEPDKGELKEAGTARVLQIFTKPMAPRGERDVTEPPEEFRSLNVLPWDEPFPSPELLGDIPSDHEERTTPGWSEDISVWGMPNTDINQHVNVEEYISGLENQFSRLLYGAGLSLPDHRVSAARLLFRKPFFPGQVYGTSGRLFVKGNETLFIGGVHQASPEGKLEDKPNIVARFQGEIRA